MLRDINLAVKGGEKVVICGPSGSGKSTMIRCVNRLEEHQQGQIIVDGVELTNDLKKIDAEIRAVVTEAAEFAQNDPEPDVSELYTDIYVNA